MNQKLKQWLAIGVSEIILALILISLAPRFLNSKKPEIGFAIWFIVPTVLAGSSIYAASKLVAAHNARKIFVEAFPEYSFLGIDKFIELPPELVASQIPLLKTVRETSAIQEYNISLFEILEQTKNETT